MHLEAGVEAALQECHVQELLEPSPHLNEQHMCIRLPKEHRQRSEIQREHPWSQIQLALELALDSRLGLQFRNR